MAKFRVSVLFALGAIICTVFLPGCSSSAISVTLSPTTTATVNQGKSLAITATVANDKSNQGVTWTLSGAGTLTNQTTTSVTYVAPSLVSIATTVTVTATSVANTTATAALSITVSPVLTITTTSLPVGTAGQAYFAVISASGATGTLTWTMTKGTLPAGLSLSSSTTSSITISGTATTVGASQFTIQVSDSSGNTTSQGLSITINPPPPLSVATKSLVDGTVGAPYNGGNGVNLQAASGVPPYTWILTSGSLPPGLNLSAAGNISGTPQTTGTFSFTVQVTDSTVPTPQTATGNLSLTINPSQAGNPNLKGNYAFLVGGFDSLHNNSHFVAAGSFTADGNGNISNGLMDSNESGIQLLNLTFSGTYALDANYLGTMAFTGVGRTFAVVLSQDGTRGRIIEFDRSGARDSGVLLQQSAGPFSTASINGNYGFGFIGTDAQANRYGFAGYFNADGYGSFNSGALDSDDATTGVGANVAFTGTYSMPSPSPNGRGTATITVGQVTTNYSFYVVSTSELLVMEIDQISGQGSPLVSGTMLQQSGLSLNGYSVLETTALETSGGTAAPQSQVGLFSWDGVQNLTLNSDLNTGGTVTSLSSQCSPNPCTYSITPVNGRVTLTNSGFPNSDPVLYLVSPNEAFIIGTDPAVTFGFMESQTGAGGFSNASLSGNYFGGSLEPVQFSANDQLDFGAADGISTLNFTTDSSTSNGLIQDQSSSGTYAIASNGRGTVTGSGNASPTSILYMVSPSVFVSMSTDANAMVEKFEQ